MSAPLSNVEYAGQFVLSREGARAGRALARWEEVGVFVYYEWGAFAIRTRDLSAWVPHSRAPTCELECVDDDGDYRWMLCTREALIAGDPLTVDYRRLPWFIAAPRVPFVDIPLVPPPWRVARSLLIHGRGVFATARIDAGYVFGDAIRFEWLVVPVFTRELCRHLNHSWTPNATLVWDWRRLAWILTATRRIGIGTEVTIDYSTTPWYATKPDPAWK